MRDLLFRDVRILDPGTGRDERGDVLVSRGRISAIGRDVGKGLSGGDALEVIDGRGRWLVPGFVDLHAHLREPGEEGKEDIASGLRAAVAGGFVDVCAMANTRPVNDSRAITELMVARGRAAALARLHPIAAITRGLGGKDLTDVSELRDAGAIALSDDGRCVHLSSVMRRALQYARTFDVPIIQHAEDHALTEGAEMHEGAVATRLGLRGWPREAEDIIVARDCIFAEEARARYHVAHLSTRGAARIVAEAKSRGVAVTAEVTPHHLLLTHEAVVGYRTECKVNPPLREAEDVAALRKALADGTIDAIATDHAPHAKGDKDVEFAEARPGMIGLEICLPLLLGLVRDGSVPLMRLLSALTLGPARVVSLEPPRLVDGARADLVLIDPEARWTVARATLSSKSENTPFLGEELQGAVEATIVEGRVVHRRDEGRVVHRREEETS
ncbi:MAG: dihydroorotase [Deltaproteobacteria bacterium]|nr:dihydroorotase [Deltaproteobacteria bacterium]